MIITRTFQCDWPNCQNKLEIPNGHILSDYGWEHRDKWHACNDHKCKSLLLFNQVINGGGMRDLIQRQYENCSNEYCISILHKFLDFDASRYKFEIDGCYSFEDGKEISIRIVEDGKERYKRYLPPTHLPILDEYCKESGLYEKAFEEFKQEMENVLKEAKSILIGE